MMSVIERFLPACLLFEKLVRHLERFKAFTFSPASFRVNLSLQAAFIHRHSDAVADSCYHHHSYTKKKGRIRNAYGFRDRSITVKRFNSEDETFFPFFGLGVFWANTSKTLKWGFCCKVSVFEKFLLALRGIYFQACIVTVYSD